MALHRNGFDTIGSNRMKAPVCYVSEHVYGFSARLIQLGALYTLSETSEKMTAYLLEATSWKRDPFS
jgi:hypothetical protein